MIEKPLATELADSQRVLDAIQKAKVDAVVGYTQRFRRNWLSAKEKVRTGALGDVTMVTSPRVHEPAGRARQLQAHQRPVEDLADGDLRHARARHRHVDDGSEEAGRDLRALGGQGARPDLQGHRRHRRRHHLRRRHRCTTR